VSLTFGLLFVAAAGWWTVDRAIGSVPASWVGAGALLLAGLLGILASLRSAARVRADTGFPAVGGPEGGRTPHLDEPEPLPIGAIEATADAHPEDLARLRKPDPDDPDPGADPSGSDLGHRSTGGRKR
jgi:hypothetical protein